MATNGNTNGHSNSHDTVQSNVLARSTDPARYNDHHKSFADSGLPSKPDGWVQRAAQVADILAEDAAVREREGKSPFAEISLLKSAGLIRLLGPTKYGGGGQGWDVAYKVIREVAKADGSLGMLLGYHLLWSWTSAVVGTDEQNDRTQKLIIENNYFVGGAVNPRDQDQKIRNDGDHVIFSGFKNFNTGGVVSDLTVLEGVSGTFFRLSCDRVTDCLPRCMKKQTSISSRSYLLSRMGYSFRTTGIAWAFALQSLAASTSIMSECLGSMPLAGIPQQKRPSIASSISRGLHCCCQREPPLQMEKGDRLTHSLCTVFSLCSPTSTLASPLAL